MARTSESSPVPLQEREVGHLVGLLGYQLRRSYFLSIQLFTSATAGLDITPIQYGILETVLDSEALAQKDVAERLGSPPQSVVPLIRDLEDRGLVERVRSEADRRRHRLALTGRGLDLLVETRDRVAAVEADLARDFDAGEQSQLLDLLRRLRRDPPARRQSRP